MAPFKQQGDLFATSGKRASNAPLTLREIARGDWHNDRPAYTGDPFMDWESEPEPPSESD